MTDQPSPDDEPEVYPYFSVGGSTLAGIQAEAGYVTADGEVEGKVIDATDLAPEDVRAAFELVFGRYVGELDAITREQMAAAEQEAAEESGEVETR